MRIRVTAQERHEERTSKQLFLCGTFILHSVFMRGSAAMTAAAMMSHTCGRRQQFSTCVLEIVENAQLHDARYTCRRRQRGVGMRRLQTITHMSDARLKRKPRVSAWAGKQGASL